MALPVSLTHILCGPCGADIVALRDGALLHWNDFRGAVAELAGRLRARTEQRWALYHGDTYRFAIGLFALLHSGKRVVLPGNAQPGTTAELNAAVDAFLGEFPTTATRPLLALTEDRGDGAELQPLDATTEIELMTSGSTGGAKIIRKQLAQLAAEIDCQEALWGAQLGAATVLATVSHQHIYGLLFRLLWPLCSHRPFVATTYAHLEPLCADSAALPRAVLVSSPAHLKRSPPALDWHAVADRIAVVFSSGGPLPQSAALEWTTALGQAPVEVFGSTETGGVAWRRQAQGAQWTPLPGVQCTLDGEGVLQVRSAFAGGNDFCATGDRAQIAVDGRFTLLGRADQVVKLEEKRVGLGELDARLCAHPWVGDARTVPLPGERAALGAVVELNAAGQAALAADGKRALNETLRAHLLQFFERVLLPRKWRYVEQLPANSQGKATRADLLALFESEPALPGELLEQSADAVLIAIDLTAADPAFAGHFPGFPVLPGVLQLDWAIRHSAQLWYAERPFFGIDQLKFQEVIGPDLRLLLNLTDRGAGTVDFTYRVDGREMSSGKIRFGAGHGA